VSGDAVTSEQRSGTAGGLARALARVWRIPELSILLALIVVCLGFTFLAPTFLQKYNLLETARNFSAIAIMALGETMVILTGGIDLSVGSVLGLSACVTAIVMAGGYGAPLGLAAGLAVGAAFGLVNGLLVTRAKLPPFIATLGTMSLGRSLAYGLTGGRPIGNLPESFLLGQRPNGMFWLNSVPIAIMLVLTALCAAYLAYTKRGRETYAVGGNETAARLSGVDVTRVKLIAYTTAGALCAVAGALMVMWLEIAQPTYGQGYELDAIAATVIGGTSLAGGQGSVIGALLGAALIGVIRNGLVQMEVAGEWQLGVLGVVIILAVIVDVLRRRNGGRIKC